MSRCWIPLALQLDQREYSVEEYPIVSATSHAPIRGVLCASSFVIETMSCSPIQRHLAAATPCRLACMTKDCCGLERRKWRCPDLWAQMRNEGVTPAHTRPPSCGVWWCASGACMLARVPVTSPPPQPPGPMFSRFHLPHFVVFCSFFCTLAHSLIHSFIHPSVFVLASSPPHSSVLDRHRSFSSLSSSPFSFSSSSYPPFPIFFVFRVFVSSTHLQSLSLISVSYSLVLRLSHSPLLSLSSFPLSSSLLPVPRLLDCSFVHPSPTTSRLQ